MRREERVRKESDDFSSDHTNFSSGQKITPATSTQPGLSRNRSRNLHNKDGVNRSTSSGRLQQLASPTQSPAPRVGGGTAAGGRNISMPRRNSSLRSKMAALGIIMLVSFALMRHSAAGRDNDKLRARVSELERRVRAMGGDPDASASTHITGRASGNSGGDSAAGGNGMTSQRSPGELPGTNAGAGKAERDAAVLAAGRRATARWTTGGEYAAERAIATGNLGNVMGPTLLTLVALLAIIFVRIQSAVAIDAQIATTPLADVIQAEDSRFGKHHLCDPFGLCAPVSVRDAAVLPVADVEVNSGGGSIAAAQVHDVRDRGFK